jgi:hypothetical protein
MKEFFDDIFVDRSFPEDNAPNIAKPRTGMLTKYIDNHYDLANEARLKPAQRHRTTCQYGRAHGSIT